MLLGLVYCDSGDPRLRAPDPVTAKTLLAAAGFTVTSLGDAWRVHGVDHRSRVTRVLAESDHYLTELSPMSDDLETVFLDLTEDQP